MFKPQGVYIPYLGVIAQTHHAYAPNTCICDDHLFSWNFADNMQMFCKFFVLFKGDTTDVRSLYCIVYSVSWIVHICDIHNITWRSLIEEIFPPGVSLKFWSLFARISSLIYPITLIWVSLERSFPPAELEYKWCQLWSKMMTSEVEQRTMLVKAGFGRHRSQDNWNVLPALIPPIHGR